MLWYKQYAKLEKKKKKNSNKPWPARGVDLCGSLFCSVGQVNGKNQFLKFIF